MTQLITNDDDEIKKEYHLKKLAKSKSDGEKFEFRVDGSIWKDGKPLAEEPTDEEKEWVLFRLSHSNTWPKVRENKIGDYRNWEYAATTI